MLEHLQSQTNGSLPATQRSLSPVNLSSPFVMVNVLKYYKRLSTLLAVDYDILCEIVKPLEVGNSVIVCGPTGYASTLLKRTRD